MCVCRQGTFVAFLGWVGAIKPDQDWTVQYFSLFIQDSLICVEMFFVAIAHGYAFGYVQYKDAEVEPLFVEIRKSGVSAIKPGMNEQQQQQQQQQQLLLVVICSDTRLHGWFAAVLQNISDTLSVKDVINDTVDVFGREFLRPDQEPNRARDPSINPKAIPKPGGSREEGYAFSTAKGTGVDYGSRANPDDAL
jgi:hypothetical protein